MSIVTTEDDRKLIGANIRRAREDADRISQINLAIELNQQLGTKFKDTDVSRWENGHRSPSRATMRAIAEILGVSLDRLNGLER